MPHSIRTPLAVSFIIATLVLGDATLAQSSKTEHTLQLDEGGAKRADATIDDLAWLAGYWVGKGLGGDVQELWTKPAGGTMFGAFSLVKEGKVVFSEAETITESNGHLELRVKHFTADFVGWEEKADFVTFPLVLVRTNEAYFSGLTFIREGDTLRVYLVLSNQGEESEVSFEFQRVPM